MIDQDGKEWENPLMVLSEHHYWMFYLHTHTHTHLNSGLNGRTPNNRSQVGNCFLEYQGTWGVMSPDFVDISPSQKGLGDPHEVLQRLGVEQVSPLSSQDTAGGSSIQGHLNQGGMGWGGRPILMMNSRGFLTILGLCP